MKIRECNQPVAHNIMKIIEAQGIKQKVVAERANVTVQAMNDMLNGRRLIKPQDVSVIARALGVTPNDLFSAEQTTPPPERVS